MPKPYRDVRAAPDPSSPWFARIASEMLGRGDIAGALKLTQAGTKNFPGYVTGALILGRCYEMMGRPLEASIEYRKVLRSLPDSETVLQSVQRMELREREEFTMFADSQRSSRDARKGTLTFDAFVGGKPAAKEDNVEVLAKQLEGAKRIVPAEPEIATPAEPVIEARRPVRIVTATLAEIYASQGEYQEAINAYRKLQEQHPEDAPRYVKRIAQLEESLRRQQPDEK